LAGGLKPISSLGEAEAAALTNVIASRLDLLSEETERGWEGRVENNGYVFSRVVRGVRQAHVLDQGLLASAEARKLDEHAVSLREVFARPATFARRSDETVVAGSGQLLDAVTGLNNNPQDFRLRPWLGFADVYVPILQDTIVEGNQALGMQLALPAFNSTNAPITYFGGAPIPIGLALGRSTATLIIVDDDFAYGEFTFSAFSYTVSENVGSAAVSVYRTNGAVGTVTVRYSATPGTASTNEFTPVSGTLTFAAGQTNRSFTVTNGTRTSVSLALDLSVSALPLLI
jgi:hypothetical protein